MSNEDTNDNALIEALPFHVMLWVAGADLDVAAEEVEVFHKMLERRSWCKSTFLQRVLPATAAAYPQLWKRFGGSKPTRGVALIEDSLRVVARTVSEEELELTKQDLRTLGESIARAAGGFLGLGAISQDEQRALRQLAEACANVKHQPKSAPAPTITKPILAGPATVEVPLWTGGRIVLRCTQAETVARDMKSFRFVAEPRVHFRYLPGQFVTMEFSIGGQQILRSYSLSSTPTRDLELEITVKRVQGGLISNWLHDHVTPGWQGAIRGPSGHFTCAPEPAERLLLLSAGSGITPVLSMARWMRDLNLRRDIVFLHSARTLEDVPFLDELRAMTTRAGFRLVLTLTQSEQPPPYAVKGRLTDAMLLETVPDYRKRGVYVCGPTPFMEHTKELLQAMGYPMDRYKAESFGGAAPKEGARRKAHSIADLLPTPEAPSLRSTIPAAPSSSKRSKPTDEVVFSRSERAIVFDGESTVLELAEQLGVRVASACRTGVCGSCKLKRLEGEVQEGCSEGLSPGEKAQGHFLACTAKPKGRLVVDG